MSKTNICGTYRSMTEPNWVNQDIQIPTNATWFPLHHSYMLMMTLIILSCFQLFAILLSDVFLKIPLIEKCIEVVKKATNKVLSLLLK